MQSCAFLSLFELRVLSTVGIEHKQTISGSSELRATQSFESSITFYLFTRSAYPFFFFLYPLSCIKEEKQNGIRTKPDELQFIG